MRPLKLAVLAYVLIISCSVAVLAASGMIVPSVESWLGKAGPGDRLAVWVFFADKGGASPSDIQATLDKLAGNYDAGAVERRLRIRPDRPFDETDLPLYKPYIETLKSEGVEFRTFSKWLNAASVVATADQIRKLAALPFVVSVRRVSGRAGAPEVVTSDAPPKEVGALYQYGQAYRQLTQIQVPQLHSEGYTGTGVKVAIFDTGFWLQHEVFASLHKIAEHDFINGDSITANQPGDPDGQHDHGTMCLSLLAANKPGTMMGPAFDASYILAKTEDISDERPIEEDWWIAAAEWADSLGAQVISSSLGYTDWYTYEDMDGNTAPITIAADLAASNGIVVVNAAGNSGASAWKYIGAPADGDSVISVGAVDSTGVRTSWSSQGPTYDGRIKPTIMAMGRADYVASTSGPTIYLRGSGTSFATPLTAGAIALILQKHPNWLPGNVIEAVMATGTRASNPDTLYGWGIFQAYTASNFAPSGTGSGGNVASRLGIYPNPCRTSFYISYPATAAGAVGPVEFYDVAGRLLGRLGLASSSPTEVRLDQAIPGVAPGVIFVQIPGRERAKILVLK
ncbi:MAG TPA: S8 family serine peptidase [bacterium]|nr:S8 family serine peptidase [bacterium]